MLPLHPANYRVAQVFLRAFPQSELAVASSGQASETKKNKSKIAYQIDTRCRRSAWIPENGGLAETRPLGFQV